MKNTLIVFNLMIVCFLFPEESVIIKSLRDKMIYNIENVNLFKEKILNEIIVDNSNDIEVFKTNGLQNIYFFDSKQIMYREVRLYDLEMPIPIVYKDFLNLPVIKQNKIFIGDLFIYKNKVYYLIGLKNEKSYAMLL
ncbi:MAG TPA: hypothetical protein PK771_11545, partial [Spirochaetota bacterium]|nr:hypothetical protein [Spirochaetota bacterium]